MDTSLFIARLIGPLLLMVAIAVLVNQANVRQMATDFLESRALIYLTGVLTLFAGLVIINTHNIWQGWPVIITIFGWLCVVGGAFRVILFRARPRDGRDHVAETVVPDRRGRRSAGRRPLAQLATPATSLEPLRARPLRRKLPPFRGAPVGWRRLCASTLRT
jgi:Flp pilus assembly protein protease CpaA